MGSLLTLCYLVAGLAHARAAFDSIVVFGDSLSDSGGDHGAQALVRLATASDVVLHYLDSALWGREGPYLGIGHGTTEKHISSNDQRGSRALHIKPALSAGLFACPSFPCATEICL